MATPEGYGADRSTGRTAAPNRAWDDLAFGEAPDRFTEHHPMISTAEGALHFAREHAPPTYSWIAGALVAERWDGR